MTNSHEAHEEQNIAWCHYSRKNVWTAQVNGGLAQAKKPNATVTKGISASSPQAANSG
jgi:hypothetical protein